MAAQGNRSTGLASTNSRQVWGGIARLGAIALAFALTCAAGKADDQYPSKPVRIVVSFAAGGPTDIVARIIGRQDGRPPGPAVLRREQGRGGRQHRRRHGRQVRAGRLHAADGDGLDPRHQSGPLQQDAVRSGARFRAGRAGRRDADACSACIRRSRRTTSRASSRWSRQNPGKYTYGSSGLGSILHLCGEQFKALAGGLDIAHVPYRGSAPMMGDLVAGQISMAFDATPTALPQAQAGAIRALGAGMAERMRAMPELPTLQEQGLQGLRVLHLERDPRARRHAAADRRQARRRDQEGAGRSRACSSACRRPASIRRSGRGPKETADFIKAELAKWAPIIKMSGAVVN